MTNPSTKKSEKIEIDLQRIIEDKIFMTMEARWLDKIEEMKREIIENVYTRSKIIAKEILNEIKSQGKL